MSLPKAVFPGMTHFTLLDLQLPLSWFSSALITAVHLAYGCQIFQCYFLMSLSSYFWLPQLFCTALKAPLAQILQEPSSVLTVPTIKPQNSSLTNFYFHRHNPLTPTSWFGFECLTSKSESSSTSLSLKFLFCSFIHLSILSKLELPYSNTLVFKSGIFYPQIY